MTRMNLLSSMKETNSMTWGKTISAHASVLIFAAVLIVCSLTVGCSSNEPKPVSTNHPIPVAQPQPQAAVVPLPAPVVAQNVSKPVQRKAPKKPATVNYTDKTYGVTFEYPRRYAIETGDAAAELLLSHPIPMNFIEPGGVALAAVELPESNYNNTDFSSAFFNVSIHKSLTADQCSQFSVPQAKIVEEKTGEKTETKSEPAPSASAIEVAKQDSTGMSQPDAKAASTPDTCHAEGGTECSPKNPTPAVATTAGDGAKSNAGAGESSNSKLMLGDLELRSTEAVSGEGTRQSDSKYFHVFQNGACYEFALNVTTDASEEGIIKHVDRDKVFSRLEQILSTVKINPVAAPEATAEGPAAAAPVTPAQ
jgi:hypothetical protein